MPADVASIRSEDDAAPTVTLGDGRRIGVRDTGSGGAAFVFLHGLLDSSAGWTAVSARLPHRSVAFDLPGFGASDLPTRPRISAYADDITDAVRGMGLGRFVLVGHSFGGAVATGVAERLRDHVAALVLLAPAGFGRIALAEAISVPGVRHVARRVMPFALANRESVRLGYRAVVTSGAAPDPAVVERITACASTVVPGAVCATQAVVAAGLSNRAFHRRGVGYDGPVDVLWGDRDRVVPPAHAANVAAALPQAALSLWRGMGHHPQRERCDQLVALLRGAHAVSGAAAMAEAA